MRASPPPPPGPRPPGAPDSALVARAQDGDADAFEALVRRHQDTVYRIALRVLGHEGDAADAAQDALVAAWHRLPDLADPASFRAWLYRIAGRRALNLARARAPEAPADRVEAAAGLPGPEQHTVAGGLRRALARALAALPPGQRACWVLRELEGMGYEEIAEVVGAGPDAVRGRIHRARARLVEELAPWR
ncbi:RNA polymerase sigma factor [Streptomonospora nanhaiensis]|uniref:RNA polymerase sigma-70 factor (ECF subfamily) n=1 Tax=Streptomonospora nanhaiensis TaxID=1323731 RepID=A0A853BS71_9ACTN|nr:sigma-70 family RNA polymerase sigma factor [Streptomonospora nanhaiensis]MBV2362657.1 sigma-70 family RNA polymerase sigma factor [Streptomonospora nanhaiensis]NYI97993.1 RNA polymerase sigma-70 factor (ECF subfamily) [Streptomonospora nanhaiensis]